MCQNLSKYKVYPPPPPLKKTLLTNQSEVDRLPAFVTDREVKVVVQVRFHKLLAAPFTQHVIRDLGQDRA